jgi:AraC-like DNA-binding protein
MTDFPTHIKIILYFCTMKTAQPNTHPMNLYPQKIKEEGIVVFDNVKGLPTGNEPFTSTDYVIAIGHRGHMDLMYDDMSDYSGQHTVGVIFPNHTLRTVSKTDDYLASLIIVDSSALDDPILQIINQMRYRYEPHPNVKLDKHEYRIITHVVEGMREITRLNLPDHRMLMSRLLEFLLRLLSHYRISKLNDIGGDKHVITRFYSDLKRHCREHRDVRFYAEQACLSTKYFSAIVKQETGHSAAHWIHNQVVAEAKLLLHMRHDLSVQAIADLLGFDDQAVFSRYFRRETGLSPSQFRETN